MTGEPMHTASKERMAPCTPAINYCLKNEVSITLCCQLCSTHYTALQIKNCLKSTSANTVKNMGKAIMSTVKSTLFAVSKDKWNTKEDTGKSIKNVLYVLWYAKRYLSGRSDVKQ